MNDTFNEDREIVKFYQNVRLALRDLLITLYHLDDDTSELIVKDLDKIVAERTKKILILHSDEVTPLLEDTISPEDTELHIDSVKSGIFNLAVTMCMHYMNTFTADDARMITVDYLESISNGLRQLNQKEENNNA